MYRDGRAALDRLKQRGVGPDGIIVIGNSLGSGVATRMAMERSVHGIALAAVAKHATLVRVPAVGHELAYQPASQAAILRWLERQPRPC